MTSSMAKVLTLAAVILILLIRPEGLLRVKVRR
jgi:branched-subunit amino acid ABC-type transport system permease component